MDSNKELLEAIRAIVKEEIAPVKADIEPMKTHLDSMGEQMGAIKDQLDIIQENVEINRHTGNLLLRWAEKADRSLNIGLYPDKKAE